MALLNYGFNFYQTRKLYAANQPVLTLPVWKGAADEVQLGVPRDVYATIPRGQEGSLSAAADVHEPLLAPLQQGAEVGKLRVTLGGRTVGAYPLHPIDAGRGSRFLRAHGRRREALAALDRFARPHSMADPLPICYLNGEFLPLRDARISPLDRGFLFGDSVYEVLPVFAGRMFRFREHFDRLARSLGEIGIPSPHCARAMAHAPRGADPSQRRRRYVCLRAGDARHGVRAQSCLSRTRQLRPYSQWPAPLPALTPEQREKGLSAITVEDFRWGRCDIKTTALLANVLMKQQAAEAGAQEAIIVRNGEVLEGASSSVFVVLSGAVITPPNSRSILPGTTRDAALEIAEGVTPIRIRTISLDELRAASEVWIAAATRDVVPVTTIDGRPVGEGKPGPVWSRMNALFNEFRARLAGTRAM